MDFTADLGNCAWHRGDGWTVLAAGRRAVRAGVVARGSWRRQGADGANRGGRSCAGSLANRRNANGPGIRNYGCVGLRTIFIAENPRAEIAQEPWLSFEFQVSSFVWWPSLRKRLCGAVHVRSKFFGFLPDDQILITMAHGASLSSPHTLKPETLKTRNFET